MIGAGLMFYNAMRFDNPLEFGQRYQLPLTVHQTVPVALSVVQFPGWFSATGALGADVFPSWMTLRRLRCRRVMAILRRRLVF